MSLASAAYADDGTPPDVPQRFVADCERQLPATQIDVVAYPSDIHYDFSEGVKELTNRPTQFRESGPHTLGLTEATFRLEVASDGDVLMDSMSQKGCARPHLTVKLKIGPQRVFVASEFPQNSCVFNEIAQHELKHVQANQDQLEKVAASLQEQLRSAFGSQIFYGNPDALKTQFVDALENQWTAWAQDQFFQVAKAHAKIDSPEELARYETMCNGEVPRVLGAEGLE